MYCEEGLRPRSLCLKLQCVVIFILKLSEISAQYNILYIEKIHSIITQYGSTVYIGMAIGCSAL